jgi:hypothetical protein
VIQLQRWGLLDAVLDSGTPAIRQVTFHALGESVSRTVKHKAGRPSSRPGGIADTILAAAAERGCADARHDVTVMAWRDCRGRVAANGA